MDFFEKRIMCIEYDLEKNIRTEIFKLSLQHQTDLRHFIRCGFYKTKKWRDKITMRLGMKDIRSGYKTLDHGKITDLTYQGSYCFKRSKAPI